MAGDWIKMRMDLQTHPKVVRILSATGADKFSVIGGLHAVWCVFDQHSENGRLDGYSLEVMDHIIGWEGFSKALADVGWLKVEDAETLVMPDFEEHNGKSAKRRAEDQKRKRASRNNPPEERTDCGQKADKKRTREEKRRYIYSDEHFAFAEYMLERIRERLPKTKTPNLERWANTIRLLNESDENPMAEIHNVFDWANRDDFWSVNIQSPGKLREKYPTLHAKAQRPSGPRPVDLEAMAL